MSSDDTTMDEGKSRFAALVGRCGDVAIGGLANFAGHSYATRVIQAATVNAIGKIRKLTAGQAYLPVFLYKRQSESGLACVAMIAASHGHDIDLATMHRRFPISAKGATLQELSDIAGDLSLSFHGARLEPSQFDQLKLPAIAHWQRKKSQSFRGDQIVVPLRRRHP